MTDANPQKLALKNLCEFQEMSYADVYALICQKRFAEAKAKYSAVLESVNDGRFDAALELEITSHFDELLEFMSNLASGVSHPEKIRAVGFDLSAHAIYENEDGICDQGIEVNLYSEDVYDFLNASDDELRTQCESAYSDWQGKFMEIDTFALRGLGSIAKQFHDYQTSPQNNASGTLETANGIAVVDPVAIARHVAKLLVAVEYHRFMSEFVDQVEVPSSMVFIIGEHDELEVPIVFYRVGEDAVEAPLLNDPLVVADEAAQVDAPVSHEDEQEFHDDVETPPLYHDETMIMEQKDAKHLENMEQVIDHVVEERSHEAGEFADALHNDDQVCEQPGEETGEAAEMGGDIKPANMVSAKSMIGLPLSPKPFGQRMNKLANSEESEEPGQDAEINDEQRSA